MVSLRMCVCVCVCMISLLPLWWWKHSSKVAFATNKQCLTVWVGGWSSVWIQTGGSTGNYEDESVFMFLFVCLCVKEWVGDLNLLNPASVRESPPPRCLLKSCDWTLIFFKPPRHLLHILWFVRAISSSQFFYSNILRNCDCGKTLAW